MIRAAISEAPVIADQKQSDKLIMSAIPASGEIDVVDAPKINPIDFLKQVIDNIKAQISSLDAEFFAASKNSAEVRSCTFDIAIFHATPISLLLIVS